MNNVIVAFPKIENAKSIKNILVRSGFHVDAAVTTGAQALQYANSLDGGILVCSPRFVDMMYTELHEYIPATFQMLLVASPDICNEHEVADIMCLSMPLKVLILLPECVRNGVRNRRYGAKRKNACYRMLKNF